MAQHRIGIAGQTGLGLSHPQDYILDNTCTDETLKVNCEKVFYLAVEEIPIFKSYEGFDYYIKTEGFAMGIEPSYQFDELFRIVIRKNIYESYIESGKSFGSYGTAVRKKQRFYSDRKSKYNTLIFKYHTMVFGDIADER